MNSRAEYSENTQSPAISQLYIYIRGMLIQAAKIISVLLGVHGDYDLLGVTETDVSGISVQKDPIYIIKIVRLKKQIV